MMALLITQQSPVVGDVPPDQEGPLEKAALRGSNPREVMTHLEALQRYR